MGARTRVCDPFDLETTQKALLEFIEDTDQVNVLILKQPCALSPERKNKKLFNVSIDETICIGEACGCNRICTRVFSCPGLIWNPEKKPSCHQRCDLFRLRGMRLCLSLRMLFQKRGATMIPVLLKHDPYNLIITGVGGQGQCHFFKNHWKHALQKRIFCYHRRDLWRIPARRLCHEPRQDFIRRHPLPPRYPRARHIWLYPLEPIETLGVLSAYGNPEVKVICNTRPTHPIGVISGRHTYPAMADITVWLESLSARSWFFDATQMATEIGDPIFANIIMAGALAGTRELPLDKKNFAETLSSKFSADKIALNLEAYDLGVGMIDETSSIGQKNK